MSTRGKQSMRDGDGERGAVPPEPPIQRLRTGWLKTTLSVCCLTLMNCSPSAPTCDQKEVKDLLQQIVLESFDEYSNASVTMEAFLGDSWKVAREGMTIQLSAYRTKASTAKTVTCQASMQILLGPKAKSLNIEPTRMIFASSILGPREMAYSAEITDRGDEVIVNILN